MRGVPFDFSILACFEMEAAGVDTFGGGFCSTDFYEDGVLVRRENRIGGCEGDLERAFTFTRDAEGRLLNVLSLDSLGEGFCRTYIYNAQGLVVYELSSPSGPAPTCDLSPEDQDLGKCDVLDYDADGRLIRHGLWYGSCSGIIYCIYYEYDANGVQTATRQSRDCSGDDIFRITTYEGYRAPGSPVCNETCVQFDEFGGFAVDPFGEAGGFSNVVGGGYDRIIRDSDADGTTDNCYFITYDEAGRQTSYSVVEASVDGTCVAPSSPTGDCVSYSAR